MFGELQGQGEDIGMTESGLLCLTPDETAVSTLTERRYWDFHVLDADTLKRERPTLKAGAGILFPSVRQVEPTALLAALGRLAERRGIRIRENCEIHEIEMNNGRATGGRTDTGLIAADTVVLCTGAWLTSLLPKPHRVPEVRPVRGQMIEYAAEADLLHNIVWSEDFETKKSHYLIPRPNGRILVGSTLEKCGFDNATTDAARDELSDFAKQVLPELAKFNIARQWAGLRPATSSAEPLIGVHPAIDNLFINGGHYRDGIALAPVSADIAARKICGETTEMDTRAFEIGG